MKSLDRPLVHLILLTLLGLLAYSNTFKAPFAFDDAFNIVENHLIRDLSNIPSFFTDMEGPFASRPFMNATFALNYRFGGLDTWGYHVVNMANHLANGFLLYFLVLLTGRHLGHEERAVRRAAVMGSLVFLVHPIQTEAVTYIVSRSMLLATSFYFLGMILFLKSATAERRKGFYIAGLFAASTLGMASRENFTTFPVMLLLYDVFFVSRFRLSEAAGHWRAYLIVIVSLGYGAYIMVNNTYDRGADFPGIGVPELDYLLTQLNVHWTYLRLLVLPVGQNVDYDYPIASTLFEIPTMFSFIGYIGLWAAAIALARRKPAVSFSVLWFLVTLMPISFGVTLLGLSLDDVISEHRLYLPGTGFAVLLAVSLTGLAEKRKALLPVLVAVVFVFGGATYARNAVWSDGISLWTDAAEKSPRKTRPYYQLGVNYTLRGEFRKAEEAYLSAVDIEPEEAMPYYNLATFYFERGLHEWSERNYLRAIELKPDFEEAHNNLANLYYRLERYEDALQEAQAAVRLNGNDYLAHFNLANIYFALGFREKARSEYEVTLALNPRFSAARKALDNIQHHRIGSPN